MASKWFLENFVPSVLNKMQNNRKYPNFMILSDRQVEVCHRNMEHKEAHTDYGWIGYYELAIDGYVLTLHKNGRYHILRMYYKVPTEGQQAEAKRIKDEINVLEDKLDVLYEHKEENEDIIHKFEADVDELWDRYNKALEV